MHKQQTIARDIEIEGVGLHTGAKVKLCLRPAEPDSGVVFNRVDKGVLIPAKSEFLQEDLLRRTCISKDGVLVNTIEHLMVVLSVMGVDNVIIDIDGEEVPGMDGSAVVFYDLIKETGLLLQDAVRVCNEIREPIELDDGKASVKVLPYDGFKVSYTLDYPEPEIGSQFYEIDFSDETKKQELLRARTFCLNSEALRLREMGLGLGANYDNTLVIGKDGPIENEFRFFCELAAHKTLDMIGDLYVAGPIKAHIKANRCGHSINAALVKEIDKLYKK